MTAYHVRMIETKEILGLFSASSIYNLFADVDEFVDPYATEYARVRYGFAIAWHDAPDLNIDSDEKCEEVIKGITLSEYGWMALDSDGLRFKQFKEKDSYVHNIASGA